MMPIKHGITPWVKQGQLPSGRGMARIKKNLGAIQDRLIDSLGGVKGITPQQDILIHSTIKGLGVMLLVELYINKEGPIRQDLLKRGIVELQPVLGKSYVAFLNSIRQNLLALGIDRKRADDILDLGRYIEQKDRAAKAKGAAHEPVKQKEAKKPRLEKAAEVRGVGGSGQGSPVLDDPRASGGEIQGNEEVKA